MSKHHLFNEVLPAIIPNTFKSKRAMTTKNQNNNARIQEIFNAIGSLPICILTKDGDTCVNMVNNAEILLSKGKITRIGYSNAHHRNWDMELKDLEKLLGVWTVMSKSYAFLEWSEDRLSSD